MQKVLVIITGGTIDAEKYSDTPEHITPLKASSIPQIFAGLTNIAAEFHQWKMKDSKLFTESEINELAQIIKSSPSKHVIVTHGTDATVKNARLLQDMDYGGKTVIFTGAMKPLSHGAESDGPANLKFSAENITSLEPGVYIVGREELSPGNYSPGLFEPQTTQKDFAKLVFRR